MYLLGVLIGSLCSLHPLWLVRVIALVLVFRHSIENHSKPYSLIPLSIRVIFRKTCINFYNEERPETLAPESPSLLSSSKSYLIYNKPPIVGFINIILTEGSNRTLVSPCILGAGGPSLPDVLGHLWALAWHFRLFLQKCGKKMQLNEGTLRKKSTRSLL